MTTNPIETIDEALPLTELQVADIQESTPRRRAAPSSRHGRDRYLFLSITYVG